MSIGSVSYYEMLMIGGREPHPSIPSSPPITPGSVSTYEFAMMGRRRRRQPFPPPIFVPTQIPSSIHDVFVAWKQILIDTGYFTPSTNVIVSLDENQYPPSGVSYCLICPLYFVPDTGSVNGGGRFCTILDGQFSTIVRTRNRMDLAYQDSYLLENEDPATGVLTLADTVMNALHLCFPEDSLGNILVAEPPRLNSWAKAERAGTQSEWGGIKLIWDVSIQIYFPSQIP